MNLLHWFPFCVYLLFGIVLTIDSFSRYHHFGERLTILGFLFYFVVILRLCLTPVSFSFLSASRNLSYWHGVPYNLVPFQQLDMEWFLNIVMTIPLGIFLYLLNRKSSFIVILCLSFLSLSSLRVINSCVIFYSILAGSLILMILSLIPWVGLLVSTL